MALEQILAHKRAELARRKAALSLEGLLARCTPSRRSLAGALRAGRPGFLLEIKFASPSAGVIRAGADLEPVLASYGRHADAVSVLTDEKFFGGSLARLAEVRQRLSQPLLCKDFILEPYQVAEARAHGADAILLILAAVDDAGWRSCADTAQQLGMEVLTEVHDREEVTRAVALGAALIGINNRDLRTLQVDPATTARLAPGIPADRLVIAESGIASREQLVALRPYADAFLVGSVLMRDAALDSAVRQLVYGRTKVCGLTRAEDARAAAEAGATHGGLIFAEASPRRGDLEHAREVRRDISLEWVGVFADQPDALIAAAADELALAAVQLHGDESAQRIEAIRPLLPAGCAVWKAARVTERLPLRSETGADRLLLDGSAAGHPFDWSLLGRYPERAEVILAGGLHPENVARAAALGSFALDVSSGVEAAPGRKDPNRLRDFFQARRRLPGRGDGTP
ncbi:MAG TPA: bifunctional indole-3-glycerol-phosphate synthase TrpC/phosphoribosylanthranilate isomerase TrpF [Gemmatimonadales bacterium]|jgi:indole-3-glycerol phosphate synthase/phosphoribosylanthranilate isomerase|nr:bifunctional indole-3-glycerol-phosphate synthase TrpC/phosphoribosylanthranilate isomerase TrpF [Gemmatimonadales bacterium]